MRRSFGALDASHRTEQFAESSSGRGIESPRASSQPRKCRAHQDAALWLTVGRGVGGTSAAPKSDVHAVRDTAERGHLLGDVPVLAIVGIVLLVLLSKSGDAVGAT